MHVAESCKARASIPNNFDLSLLMHEICISVSSITLRDRTKMRRLGFMWQCYYSQALCLSFIAWGSWLYDWFETAVSYLCFSALLNWRTRVILISCNRAVVICNHCPKGEEAKREQRKDKEGPSSPMLVSLRCNSSIWNCSTALLNNLPPSGCRLFPSSNTSLRHWLLARAFASDAAPSAVIIDSRRSKCRSLLVSKAVLRFEIPARRLVSLYAYMQFFSHANSNIETTYKKYVPWHAPPQLFTVQGPACYLLSTD